MKLLQIACLMTVIGMGVLEDMKDGEQYVFKTFAVVNPGRLVVDYLAFLNKIKSMFIFFKNKLKREYTVTINVFNKPESGAQYLGTGIGTYLKIFNVFEKKIDVKVQPGTKDLEVHWEVTNEATSNQTK